MKFEIGGKTHEISGAAFTLALVGFTSATCVVSGVLINWFNNNIIGGEGRSARAGEATPTPNMAELLLKQIEENNKNLGVYEEYLKMVPTINAQNTRLAEIENTLNPKDDNSTPEPLPTIQLNTPTKEIRATESTPEPTPKNTEKPLEQTFREVIGQEAYNNQSPRIKNLIAEFCEGDVQQIDFRGYVATAFMPQGIYDSITGRASVLFVEEQQRVQLSQPQGNESLDVCFAFGSDAIQDMTNTLADYPNMNAIFAHPLGSGSGTVDVAYYDGYSYTVKFTMNNGFGSGTQYIYKPDGSLADEVKFKNRSMGLLLYDEKYPERIPVALIQRIKPLKDNHASNGFGVGNLIARPEIGLKAQNNEATTGITVSGYTETVIDRIERIKRRQGNIDDAVNDTLATIDAEGTFNLYGSKTGYPTGGYTINKPRTAV